MKPSMACHEWLVMTCCAEAETPAANSAATFWIDVHRNRRGPFTAAGGLVRAIIADATRATPGLITTHLVTLLSVAPEISHIVDIPADVRQALTPGEGHPVSRILRIAHGVTDFVLGYFEAQGAPGRIAVFANADEADPTDREFIAVLLRRADPRKLRLRICTVSDRLEAPLAAALEQYARRQRPKAKRSRAPKSSPDDDIFRLSAVDRNALARAYVDTDGAAHNLLAEQVYRRLPASERKAMHLARAASLSALEEPSLALGAIPFHHEQAGDNAEPLLIASRTCLDMACYDAALDWSVRGRRMLSHAPRSKTYSDLTRNMLFALLLLDRYDEVSALCEDLLSHSEDAALLAHATYAMAILNARLYERSRQDYDAARSWVEKSQKFTDSVPASPARGVIAAFLMNTLALVEMRKGRPEAAQQKLTEAMELMARTAPELYREESIILLHNMARLHIATGDSGLAIDNLNILLSQLPSDSAAWFDLGLIHQRAGRHQAALDNYDMAIRWEPAHVEAHFNRALTLTALGRLDEAISGYGRVIVLQPDFVGARLDRAVLLRERGDLALASDDIAAALQYQPGDARLLCLQGLIEMATGDRDIAFDTFTRSIEMDPSLADPWANRAIIAFRRGDVCAALHDLTRAAALREDAAILYNRGRVLESQRQWQKAADDYARARVLAGADREAIDRGYQRCLEALRRKKLRSR